MRKSANPDTSSETGLTFAGAGAQSLNEINNVGAFVLHERAKGLPCAIEGGKMKTWAALFRPLDACKGKRKGGGGKRK